MPPVERAFRTMVDAFNARDWEGDVAALHRTSGSTHHRPMLRNEVTGGEAVAATLREAAAPFDVTWTAERLAGNARVQLITSTWSGVAEGAAFAVDFLDLHGLGADGVLAYAHTFELAQEAEARALYEQLASGARPGAPSSRSSTSSWPRSGRGTATAQRHLGTRLPPEDHRPGMRHDYAGLEAQVRTWETVLDRLPDLEIELEVLQSRRRCDCQLP